MGELNKKPIHNVFKDYRKMNLVNPYRFGKKYINFLIAYYRLNNNLIDQKNSYNGSGSVSFGTGKISSAVSFSGSTFFTVNDVSNFSFTNGLVDSPCSGVISVNFNSTATQNIFNKRQDTSTGAEYTLFYESGNVVMRLYSQGGVNYIDRRYPLVPTFGTWYNIAWTYNGSGVSSGIKIYINNVEGGTTGASGTYTGMSNTTSNIYFGRAGWFSGHYVNGLIDCVGFFNGYELTASDVTEINNSINSGIELL